MELYYESRSMIDVKIEELYFLMDHRETYD